MGAAHAAAAGGISKARQLSRSTASCWHGANASEARAVCHGLAPLKRLRSIESAALRQCLGSFCSQGSQLWLTLAQMASLIWSLWHDQRFAIK
eukprot:1144419-Pelagomonas_calceolata.AAC.7